MAPYSHQSPLWGNLSDALATENWHEWNRARAEVLRLNGLKACANRLKTLIDRLSELAPQWAISVRKSNGDSLQSWAIVSDAWRWRQLATWFEQTTAGRDPAKVEAELRQLAKVQSQIVADLVAAKAWTYVVDRIDGPTQVALGAYQQADARARQRFSKFAPMYQRQVRAALDECRHAVPVWIMPVERALADFRCESTPPFDILIVDEASQISISRLPVLGLARRAIVVGDNKQMSPSTPGLELQPIFDLIRTRLPDVPKADTTFHPNSSLYDAALTHFPRQVKLTEHFRCLTEIISFSNSRYYGNALVPLRDQLPSPGWKPIHSVLISNGYRDYDDCNRPEAEYAAALIRHCTQVRDAAVTFDRLEQLIDARSPFEREVLHALIDRGYRTIRPQYRIGRYRIDFVIEGPHSRLALECDGERFHGPDQWDVDRARQDVLERVGWSFVRIRGSSFYRNPVQALQPLWNKLDELGIPSGEWRTTSTTIEIEVELQKVKPKIVEVPPETIGGNEAKVTKGEGVTSGNFAQSDGDDPWGAAFSAANYALRFRAQSTDKGDDHS